MFKLTRKMTLYAFAGIFSFILMNNPLASSPSGGDEYLAFAEVMPQPSGGLPEIYKKIKYPDIAMKAGIQGKVYVLALIDERGNVNDVKVLKGIGGGCDQAAADAIKSSKFTPGSNKGKPVKVKLSMVINFKL